MAVKTYFNKTKYSTEMLDYEQYMKNRCVLTMFTGETIYFPTETANCSK